MAPIEKKAADRCSICKLHIFTLESRAETTCRLVPLVPLVPLAPLVPLVPFQWKSRQSIGMPFVKHKVCQPKSAKCNVYSSFLKSASPTTRQIQCLLSANKCEIQCIFFVLLSVRAQTHAKYNESSSYLKLASSNTR